MCLYEINLLIYHRGINELNIDVDMSRGSISQNS